LAWTETDIINSQRAEEMIQKVIASPGGWLVDDTVDDIELNQLSRSEGYDARKKEMEALRRQCIPNLFFLWHGVLYETNVEKSATLADIVADDYQKLYLLFSKDELEHLLTLVRKSFIRYLEEHSKNQSK